MRLLAAIAALLLFAVPLAFARDIPASPPSHKLYRLADGSRVHGPTQTASARLREGSSRLPRCARSMAGLTSDVDRRNHITRGADHAEGGTR